MQYTYMIIPLTRGAFAYVDEDVYVWASRYRWHCTAKGYAARRRSVQEGGGVELLHRAILGLRGKQQGDHRNRDKLDNRRDNLRVATNGQNQVNQPPDKTNTTGYKGVIKARNRPGYIAQIKVEGKNVFLGYFRNKKDAARAYNRAAEVAFGEYAYLNEVD